MSTLPLPQAAAGAVPSAPAGSALWRRAKGLVSTRLGYALADQVVYSFGNMVLAAMVSRHCAQRQFGVYILTQRAMDVLIQLSNVFLWAPFTFNLPGIADEERSRYQGSMLTLQVFACLVFTATLCLAAHWTKANREEDFYQTFLPLIGAGGGILFREFTRRMYFAQMRFKEAFWTEVATVALQIAGAEWLYLSGHLTVSTTLYVLCGGASIVSLWWLIRDGRRLRFQLAATWQHLRLNLRLGRWFLGSNMVFLASSQWNPWVLGATLGGASVGAYAVCESVVNIPRVALTSMQNVMGPTIAQAQATDGARGVQRVVRRLDRMLFIGSSLFALAIWAMGPLAARIIFRTVPVNARSVLGLLSLNLVVYAGALAQSYGLTALGRADTTLYANAAGLAVQGVICFGLVKVLGVTGAALAMLIGNVVVLAVRQWSYRRELAVA